MHVVLPPKRSNVSRHGTDAQDASIAPWDRSIESDDWLRLKTQQAHVTYIAIAVAHPYITIAVSI